MGCGGSKVEDLPLVTLCRERKEFLKAASEQRYALAAAHIAYFHSLRDIGDALTKFADQDLFFSGSSSPVLTLPSDEPKPKKKNNTSSSSPSISISHADSLEGSHLHLSSGSEFSSPSSDHIHLHHSPEPKHKPRHRPRPEPEPDTPPSSSSSPHPPPFEYHYYNPQDWNQPPGMNTYAYYMKSSAPHGKSMVYEEEERHVAKTGQWSDSPNGYGYGYGYGYGNGGFFGSPAGDYSYYSQAGPSSSPAPPPPPPPAPPSPPRVSTWDFLNFFDSYDYGYQGRYGIGSIASSPDSKEVREREGIPELEDETEHEVLKEEIRHKEKKKFADEKAQKEKMLEFAGFELLAPPDRSVVAVGLWL